MCTAASNAHAYSTSTSKQQNPYLHALCSKESMKELMSLTSKAAVTVFSSSMTHSVLWLPVSEHRLFSGNEVVDTRDRKGFFQKVA